MTQVVENVMALIAELPAKSRHELVNRIIESGILCQSSEDALLIESRRGEPTRPYQAFRRTLKTKR